MGWFRGVGAEINPNWLYIFTGYASESAAKADLTEFVANDNWRSYVTGGIAVSGEEGYCLAVGSETPRDDLYNDNSNCKIEFYLRSKTANRTKIPYLTLVETTIDGLDPSTIYYDWHTTGILPSRPLGDPSSWMYQRVDGPEVHLHHNNDGIVADIVTQAGLAAFGVNGGASGGRSFSAPVYVRADDSPIYDITPTSSPFGFYPSPHNATFQNVICADVAIPDGATIANGTDDEIAFLDWTEENGRFREFWKTSNTGGAWSAHRGGIMTDLTDSDLQFGRPFGAAATGNSMVHQQPTVDEFLYGPGYAPHALALTVISATRMWSWPAVRTDGATSPHTVPNKIMEGARFRWDPEVDIDALNLHPLAKFYLKTWQKYGGMVNDRGGSLGTRVENEMSHINLGVGERWPDIYDGSAFWQIFSAHNGYSAVDWSQMQVLPARYGHPNWQPGRLRGLAWHMDTSDVNYLSTNSGQSFQPSQAAYDVSGNGCELTSDTVETAPDYSSTGWNSTRSGQIYYRADDTRLTTKSAKNLTLGAGQETLTVGLCTGIRTAVHANSRILSVVGDGETADDDNDASFYIGIDGTGTNIVCVRNGNSVVLGAATVAQLNWMMVVWDGAEMTPYWNGVAGTPVASTGTWAEDSNITIGNISGGGQAYEGRFGTAFIAASDDGIDQAADMDSYFNSVWSI
jgi:hypothetical protein